MTAQEQRTIAGRGTAWLPVVGTVGAMFVGYQLWGYVAWALDGGSKPFEIKTSVPASIDQTVLLGRIVPAVIAALWLTYVIRGVLRDRSLTWPLLITLAWALTYWQESLANVTGARFAYNSEFYDRGDWTGYMPFINPSGPGLAQPLQMETLVFIGMFPVFSWGAAALMRALRARTRWSPWLIALVTYAVVLVVEFGAEMRSMAGGAHAYPEVFGALSIRDGQPDQFPLYENWLLALMWFLPGLLVFVARDLRDNRLPTVRPVLAVLATTGALNMAFLLYNLVAFVWLPADTTADMPPWLDPVQVTDRLNAQRAIVSA